MSKFLKNKNQYVIIVILGIVLLGGFGYNSLAINKSGDFVGDQETKLVSKLNQKAESETGSSTLISVKKSDEKKFSSEEWEKVLKQIEDGEVYLEEDDRDARIEHKTTIHNTR